jgi:ubiquinone/menaquinone biosynthesis C-methylase UbiE
MKRMRRIWVFALVAWHSLIVAHHAVAQTDGQNAKGKSGPRVYKGRVIAPVMTAAGGGAEWLERADRDATEQPDKVIEALKIPLGSVVADVGAGTGYFSMRIAKKIGPDGKVLATDVQPEMLRQLSEAMKQASVRNIDRILATATDAKLPPNKVDLVLMVDVYHELQDPERTMAQVRKSLKENGRLVLVEYRAEDPDVPIRPEHKTTLRQIRYEVEPMGFRLHEAFEFLPHQHIEVFVKDDVKGEDPIVDPARFPTVQKPGWAGAGAAEPYENAEFKALFNGQDLSGWTGDTTVWRVRDGLLVGTQTDSSQTAELKTTESHEEFELDLQWALTEPEGSAGVWIGSNPRLFIRLDAGVPHGPGYPETIAGLRTAEVTRSREGAPVSKTSDTANAVVLPGEWNRLTVRCTGHRVALAVNGVQVAEFDSAPSKLAGPIGLESSKSDVLFREIWLKRLGK